jgi:hypothetical protein
MMFNISHLPLLSNLCGQTDRKAVGETYRWRNRQRRNRQLEKQTDGETDNGVIKRLRIRLLQKQIAVERDRWRDRRIERQADGEIDTDSE